MQQLETPNTILGIDGGAPEGSTPETAVELNNGL